MNRTLYWFIFLHGVAVGASWGNQCGHGRTRVALHCLIDMTSQFNPIDYARQLEEAGVPQAQAQVHANLAQVAAGGRAGMPDDLDAPGAKLVSKMDDFEEKLTVKLEKMTFDLNVINWLNAINTIMLIAILVKLPCR